MSRALEARGDHGFSNAVVAADVGYHRRQLSVLQNQIKRFGISVDALADTLQRPSKIGVVLDVNLTLSIANDLNPTRIVRSTGLPASSLSASETVRLHLITGSEDGQASNGNGSDSNQR